MKKTFVSPETNISIVQQCSLLELPRSTFYYCPRPLSKQDQELMRKIDEIYTKSPYYGARKISHKLKKMGYQIGRKHTGTLMERMGISAIFPKRLLSKPHPGHKKYPYLLKGLEITYPNHVLSADITYIRLKQGFVYLVAIMDWFSRKILSWRLSITLDSRFCCDALLEAMQRYGTPVIFNTDQGAQFTGEDFTGLLNEAGVQISMDGRGRALDNVFIERFWRSLKYEEVYLTEYLNVQDCRQRIGRYIDEYNKERPHETLKYQTPDEIYFGFNNLKKVA